jgi:hypothetical protein
VAWLERYLGVPDSILKPKHAVLGTAPMSFLVLCGMRLREPLPRSRRAGGPTSQFAKINWKNNPKIPVIP